MVHHSKTKIILGPPGTGKTHNLLNLVKLEMMVTSMLAKDMIEKTVEIGEAQQLLRNIKKGIA